MGTPLSRRMRRFQIHQCAQGRAKTPRCRKTGQGREVCAGWRQRHRWRGRRSCGFVRGECVDAQIRPCFGRESLRQAFSRAPNNLSPPFGNALALVRPIGHSLDSDADLPSAWRDAAERRDDLAGYVMIGLHGAVNIRSSDYSQARIYPKVVLPKLIPSWHDMQMTDSAFDIDLVRAAMAKTGTSQADIAEAIGLPSQSAFSNILNGKRRVTASEAAMIYRYLDIERPSGQSVTMLPIIGLANAGRWREAIQMPLGSMPVPHGAVGKRSFVIEVRGDSMNQLIGDGGFVVIDPDKKELVAGACYLIQNHDFEATVKMYQRDPARFEPCSDNEEHVGFLAADVDFTVLGRVVWKGAPM